LPDTAEFLAERDGKWKRITGLMCDFEVYPDDRLKSIRQAGIRWVMVLNSGNNSDCPACKDLTQKIYPIDGAPKLPPANCSCTPWCRSDYIATELSDTKAKDCDIAFKCVHCSQKIVIVMAGAGLSVICPTCKKVIVVPK